MPLPTVSLRAPAPAAAAFAPALAPTLRLALPPTVCLALPSPIATSTAAQVLQVAIAILRKLRRFPEAMRLALRLRDDDAISEIMTACDDPLVSKQMAYMLARQGVRSGTLEAKRDYSRSS